MDSSPHSYKAKPIKATMLSHEYNQQEYLNNITQLSEQEKNLQADESKCDDCHQNEFQFYCKKCHEYLCIECNQDNHKRGDRKLHDRIEVYKRQKKIMSLCCKIHPDQEVRWFCKTCRHPICEQCCDHNGPHRQHDCVLHSTMANDLKSEVNTRYIEVAGNRKEPIINALETLEAILYDIGVKGVISFKNAIDKDNSKHVSSLERAKNDVIAHYAAIRHLAIDMEEFHLRQIEELAQAKSDAVMNHIKILHADLDQIVNCCDAKEAMIASPAMEACASHSDVMALLDDLEAHMSNIKITLDSSIPVTVCTSDILHVLEKSCYVGGPSTPGEVLIEVVDKQCRFGISWNTSEVGEGKPKVSSYIVEVKIVHAGEAEDPAIAMPIPHKYAVMASTSSSSSSSSSSAVDSDRVRLFIKDKAFEGQKVYAIVTATDVNGACSGKGVSESVVLPDQFGPLPVVSFSYVADFDENGLLYHIGTAGGTRAYVNPHVSGDVVVTWSSIEGGHVENLVNNQLNNNQSSYTAPIVGSWMMVDLGATRRISPDHYSLRHDRGNIGHFLRYWVLEGKMDDSDTSAWVLLREHVNDASINGKGATCSWSVTNVGSNQSFRYIRIRMTGASMCGSHYLMCSGIELYGDMY